jgi:hypothetical protein
MNFLALGAIMLAAVAVLAVSWASRSRPKNTPAELAQPVFDRVFAPLSPPPKLKSSWSFGYPAFDVTFASEAELQRAAALSADFKRELNRVFKNHGPRDRPFDAELAVLLTYPSHIKDLAKASRDKA